MEKTEFMTYWADLDPHKFFSVSRDRVAYLLRAARSRGSHVERLRADAGEYYRIGERCINVLHPNNRRLLSV